MEPDGTVCVDGGTIGRLDGFRFAVDPATRHQDRKMLLAAAERRLGRILRVKADELLGAPDTDFALTDEAGQAPGISWQGNPVASLHGGSALLAPEIRLEIGRAHVCTPVTNAHLVCRLLLEKKK